MSDKSVNEVSAPLRPMRADARRNYEQIVAEAQAAFAEHGLDASLEDIARRAGVGIGTLYRHFPTRDALLETVLRHRLQALSTWGDDLLAADAPGDVLLEWVRRFVETATAYRGLAGAIVAAMNDPESELHAPCLDLHDTAARLLAHAQRHGTLRDDVEVRDVLTLATALAWSTEQPDGPTRQDHLLSLVVDGLRRR